RGDERVGEGREHVGGGRRISGEHPLVESGFVLAGRKAHVLVSTAPVEKSSYQVQPAGASVKEALPIPRPPLNTAPCSLPALRSGEHDRPRDGAPARSRVLSAAASPRAARDDHYAQTPAKPGVEPRELRPSPARARVKRRGPTGWWGRMNGSSGRARAVRAERVGDAHRRPLVNPYPPRGRALPHPQSADAAPRREAAPSRGLQR